jgi:hypothetical protein
MSSQKPSRKNRVPVGIHQSGAHQKSSPVQTAATLPERGRSGAAASQTRTGTTHTM